MMSWLHVCKRNHLADLQRPTLVERKRFLMFDEVVDVTAGYMVKGRPRTTTNKRARTRHSIVGRKLNKLLQPLQMAFDLKDEPPLKSHKTRQISPNQIQSPLGLDFPRSLRALPFSIPQSSSRHDILPINTTIFRKSVGSIYILADKKSSMSCFEIS